MQERKQGTASSLSSFTTLWPNYFLWCCWCDVRGTVISLNAGLTTSSDPRVDSMETIIGSYLILIYFSKFHLDASSLFSQIKERKKRKREAATRRCLLLKVNDFSSGFTLMLLRKIFIFESTCHSFSSMFSHRGKKKNLKLPDKETTGKLRLMCHIFCCLNFLDSKSSLEGTVKDRTGNSEQSEK